jgi:hypothetical protein
VSNWVMFRGTDTTSLPTSSLKKVRFHSPRYSAFQFGNVSRIVEYPPAGQDSFCKAEELRQDPSGRDDCVRCRGYNSDLFAIYASYVAGELAKDRTGSFGGLGHRQWGNPGDSRSRKGCSSATYN